MGDQAELLREEGNALYRRRLFEDAITKYEAAGSAAASPSASAVALRNVAQCYWQLGNSKDSLKFALEALRLDEQSCKAHFRAAECFAKMKLWDYACLHYSK